MTTVGHRQEQKGHLSSSASRIENLWQIFDNMSYASLEDKQNSDSLSMVKPKYTSVINGQTIVGSQEDSFVVHPQNVTVSVNTLVVSDIDSKVIPVLKKVASTIKKKDASVGDQTAFQQKRLKQLADVLKNEAATLAKLEAMATRTPVKQIIQNDQPVWLDVEGIYKQSHSIQEALSTLRAKDGKGGGCPHIFINLEHHEETYSLRTIMGAIITCALWKDGPVLLSVSTQANGRHLFLPLAHVVDLINSRIKCTNEEDPISLLHWSGISTPFNELLKRQELSNVIVWGNGGCDVTSAETFRPTSHFVVDATAELHSAIDSIAQKVWTCGTMTRSRCRSLVFVQECVHDKLVSLLEEKLKGTRVMKLDDDKAAVIFVNDEFDFISRKLSNWMVEKSKELTDLLGVTYDLRLPTVIPRIGTSAPFLIDRKAGTGHVVCVIPFRSQSELISLANNQWGGRRGVLTTVYTTSADAASKSSSSLMGDVVMASEAKAPKDPIYDTWRSILSSCSLTECKTLSLLPSCDDRKKAAKAWNDSFTVKEKLETIVTLFKDCGLSDMECLKGIISLSSALANRSAITVGLIISSTLPTSHMLLSIATAICMGHSVVVLHRGKLNETLQSRTLTLFPKNLICWVEEPGIPSITKFVDTVVAIVGKDDPLCGEGCFMFEGCLSTLHTEDFEESSQLVEPLSSLLRC